MGLITGVRSVEFAVVDLDRALGFYTQTWGLALVDRSADAAFLRGQGPYNHILVLRRASAPTIVRFTFDVADRPALQALHARIKAAGLPVSLEPRALETPGGGIGFDSRDPEGRNISFACDVRDHTEVSLVPDRMTKVTHLNLNSGAYEATRGYLVETLGMRIVDETKMNGFFNCNRDHHSIVVGRRTNAALNHVAFEMPDLNSMMRQAGTMREAGYPIEWGVGRHGPGDNVFAYFAGPEEIPIECTAEILQIDENYVYRGPEEWNFPPGRTDQWGVTDQPSARIKRIQNQFCFPTIALR